MKGGNEIEESGMNVFGKKEKESGMYNVSVSKLRTAVLACVLSVGVNAFAGEEVETSGGETQSHSENVQSREELLKYYSELLYLPIIEGQEENLLEIGDVVRAGREEYISGILLSEKYTTGRYTDKSEEFKNKRAVKSWDSKVDKFFKGIQNSGAKYLVVNSPELTQNLLDKRQDLIVMNPLLQGVLNKLSVTQSRANIEESRANIEESRENTESNNRQLEKNNRDIEKLKIIKANFENIATR